MEQSVLDIERPVLSVGGRKVQFIGGDDRTRKSVSPQRVGEERKNSPDDAEVRGVDSWRSIDLEYANVVEDTVARPNDRERLARTPGKTKPGSKIVLVVVVTAGRNALRSAGDKARRWRLQVRYGEPIRELARAGWLYSYGTP